MLFGNVRDEFVRGVARQIEQAGVGAFFIRVAGVASHHVGVDVNRIDGIGDGDDVSFSKDVEDVAGVAL